MKKLTHSLCNSTFLNKVESRINGITKQGAIGNSIINAVPTGFVPAVAMFASALLSS